VVAGSKGRRSILEERLRRRREEIMKRFIRKSEIPIDSLPLYREAKRNIGHSGHHFCPNGSLPAVENYDPFMVLKEEEKANGTTSRKPTQSN